MLDEFQWTVRLPIHFKDKHCSLAGASAMPQLANDALGVLLYPDVASATTVATGRRRLLRRYRWPDEIPDEGLARFLYLNAKRAEEERLSGAAASAAGKKGTKRGRKTATRSGRDASSAAESA